MTGNLKRLYLRIRARIMKVKRRTIVNPKSKKIHLEARLNQTSRNPSSQMRLMTQKNWRMTTMSPKMMIKVTRMGVQARIGKRLALRNLSKKAWTKDLS